MRLSGARILGCSASMCIGTVIRVRSTNVKEISNLKDDLPRWWADGARILGSLVSVCIDTVIRVRSTNT